jgi:hypothetical protein
MKDEYKGQNHHSWKGNKVTINALHLWLNVNYKKPKRCVKCNKIKKLDWANISGKYTRNIKDYNALCEKCHMILDKQRKPNKKGQFRCCVCKRYKLPSEYFKEKSRPLGFGSRCKKCTSKTSTESRTKVHLLIKGKIHCKNNIKYNLKSTEKIKLVTCKNCLKIKILKEGGLI